MVGDETQIFINNRFLKEKSAIEKKKKCKNSARIIAYYLPQFYETEINNIAWEKGFTEWTNVAAARPYFRGHYQPQLPSDLGFYDLRNSEVRERQAFLAKESGVEGFCYWHYWFGNGRMELDLPIREVSKTGSPDFPFCMGWANHSWKTDAWSKAKSKHKYQNNTIIQQEYPGVDDIKRHFDYMLPLFKDKRYIMVDGKPLFLIFDPYSIPDVSEFIRIWNALSKDNGLKGVHFVARATSVTPLQRQALSIQDSKNAKDLIDKVLNLRKSFRNWKNEAAVIFDELISRGFDAVVHDPCVSAEIAYSRDPFIYAFRTIISRLFPFTMPYVFEYKKLRELSHIKEEEWENIYPTIIPRLDKTPRENKNRARIYKNSSPKLFYEDATRTIKDVKNKCFDHRIIFLQSWNEWGEGNYMEPDRKFGHGYIRALRKAVDENL